MCRETLSDRMATLKQARARATYEMILQGAALVFSRYGFERARLNQIVEAAGLTRGALYFHFQSKEDLASAVINRQYDISRDAVNQIAATEKPALAQMVMLSHEIGRLLAEDIQMQAGIRLSLEQSVAEGPSETYDEWLTAYKALADKAVEEGDMLSDVDPATLAQFVVPALTGIQLVSNVRVRRSDLPARIDEMWQLLLPAILRPDSQHDMQRLRLARLGSEDSDSNRTQPVVSPHHA